MQMPKGLPRLVIGVLILGMVGFLTWDGTLEPQYGVGIILAIGGAYGLFRGGGRAKALARNWRKR